MIILLIDTIKIDYRLVICNLECAGNRCFTYGRTGCIHAVALPNHLYQVSHCKGFYYDTTYSVYSLQLISIYLFLKSILIYITGWDCF